MNEKVEAAKDKKETSSEQSQPRRVPLPEQSVCDDTSHLSNARHFRHSPYPPSRR